MRPTKSSKKSRKLSIPKRTGASTELKTNPKNLLTVAEWTIAGLVMLFVLCLHVINRTYVGHLWRDETNSVALAELPSFSELWQHAEFDSVPILWLAFLQKLSQFGLAVDDLFRNLGLGIGLAICAVLWVNARTFKHSFPFFTLSLLGLSAAVIRYGDSLRAYGLGMVFILLTLGLVWKFITEPSTKTFAFAVTAAILSVHLNFHNDFQIFAICCGATIAAATQKRWKICLATLGIGTITAATMLVYLPVFHREFEWYHVLLAPSFPLDLVFGRLWSSLELSGDIVPWLWLFLIAGFLFAGAFCLSNKRSKLTENQRSLLVYSLATLILSTVVTALFLRHMRVYTAPWHYTGWMAVAAACMELGFFTLGGGHRWARIARMVLPILVLILTFSKVSETLKTRLTNYDLVARLLAETATERDYILVNPWEQGVTFHHYYNGTAKWDTVPPIEDHRFHRFDQVKAMMLMPETTEAVRPVTEKIEATLKNGGRLWLVRGLPFLPEGATPPKALPSAPNSPYKWFCGAYTRNWLTQVAYYVQTHALRAKDVPLENLGPVSKYENATLLVVEGWRDSPPSKPFPKITAQ